MAGTGGGSAGREASAVVSVPTCGPRPSFTSAAWKRWTSRSTAGLAGARKGYGARPITTMRAIIGARTNPSRTVRSGRWRLCSFVIFPKKTFSTRSSM